MTRMSCSVFFFFQIGKKPGLVPEPGIPQDGIIKMFSHGPTGAFKLLCRRNTVIEKIYGVFSLDKLLDQSGLADPACSIGNPPSKAGKTPLHQQRSIVLL